MPIPLTPQQLMAASANPTVRVAADDEMPAPSPVEVLRRNAAPLGVSFVFHLGLMILLGILSYERYEKRAVTLESTTYDLSPPTLSEIRAPASLDPVEVADVRPLASMPLLPRQVNVPISPFGRGGFTPSTDAINPNVPAAVAGRGIKGVLLSQYGGNKETEESVEMALEWLARKQLANGMWCLSGKEGPVKSQYSRGAKDDTENHEAATAMALLAFFGGGYNHREGKYAKAIDTAVKALLRTQNAEGSFFKGQSPEDWLYTHAQCTMALCELFALTGDTNLKTPCEKAVQFIVDAQASEGGWRYRPRQDSDTSVTGWMLLALQSARNAKLRVPQETMDNVGKYLDLAAAGPAGVVTRQTIVTLENSKPSSMQALVGSRYAYMHGEDVDNAAMTAEGLLCRMYLGWANDDPRLQSGMDFLLENHPPTWGKRDVYYWYYATQAMFHFGGEPWKRWNGMLRDQLVANQEKSGGERGSWDPLSKTWPMVKEDDGSDTWSMSGRGGRLYVTCFSVYMLEVYYRHLPLYSELKKELEAKQKAEPKS